MCILLTRNVNPSIASKLRLGGPHEPWLTWAHLQSWCIASTTTETPRTASRKRRAEVEGDKSTAARSIFAPYESLNKNPTSICAMHSNKLRCHPRRPRMRLKNHWCVDDFRMSPRAVSDRYISEPYSDGGRNRSWWRA